MSLPPFHQIVSVVVLVLALIVSIAIPVVQIWIARRRATLDFIHRYNSEVRTDRAVAIMCTKKPWSTLGNEDKANIRYILNMVESFAIGIRHKVYDGKMARETLGMDVWVLYNKIAEPYIRAMREEDAEKYPDAPGEHQRAYSEFEKLAEQYKTNTPPARE